MPVEPNPPRAFIPPAPERPAARTSPRMPTYEDFPVPAQNEFRARRGETNEADHPEKRRLTLLQRLAAVGLGRKDDEAEEPAAEPIRQLGNDRTLPRARANESRGPEPVSEFAKRGNPKGLDMHGRTAPVHMSSSDDQLDIPAFLRRQAT
jgi:cell division protein FtsZ